MPVVKKTKKISNSNPHSPYPLSTEIKEVVNDLAERERERERERESKNEDKHQLFSSLLAMSMEQYSHSLRG